ncbi:MAG: ribonuclease Z [Firmicutes bacterium]|nr:ribonuclease Z [Bacillota bacterium]
MQLYFFGTGAGRPSLERNVSSLALKLPQSKEIWLFDCGEGTQHQILASPFKLRKIKRLFITHLHGDHIFGLPGFLASRSFSAKDQKMALYGPPGIAEFLETTLRTSFTRLSYPLEITEIEPDAELELGSWRIKVGLLDHGLVSYGYRLEEPHRPGRLQAEKLERLGIPAGPLYGRLKRGETVVLESGEILEGKDFVGPIQPGRSVVILGDTRYSPASAQLAKGADLLVHEATFEAALAEKAFEYYHSTTLQAAQVAQEAGVGKLVLTHFSSRYRRREYAALLAEAKKIFPRTYLAEDHSSFTIPRKT